MATLKTRQLAFEDFIGRIKNAIDLVVSIKGNSSQIRSKALD